MIYLGFRRVLYRSVTILHIYGLTLLGIADGGICANFIVKTVRTTVKYMMHLALLGF
jgi:hypothetical protein